MDRPPLPEPVARQARSYLAALVPAGQTSDAWHELVADVTYWRDHEELPVLRLAHQVVLQHERVTDEVAVLALDELGISSPHAVAAVLDVSEGDAEALIDRVAALAAEAERPGDVHVFDAEAGVVGTRPAAGEQEPVDVDPPTHGSPGPDDPPPDTPAPDDPEPATPESQPGGSVTTPGPDPDRHGSRAVRIGFEDDDVVEVGGWDDGGAGLDARRWAGIVAVVIGAAILLWLLTG